MLKSTYAITGVSNGIGREIALIAREKGHRVIGLDIAEPRDNIDQFIQLDLSDPASISKAVSEIKAPLDGICNSAGLPPRPGLMEKILAVNFTGTREFTRLARPKLNPGASVVNLASRAGQRWRDGVDQIKRLSALQTNEEISSFIERENIDPVRAYDLSKEAVILWTMASSENYNAAGLRINSISPGAVETRILGDFATAFGDRMAKAVNRAGRAGWPREIAHLAAFLLSPESSWIKGTDVGIDGGMSAFTTADALSLEALV